MIIDESIKTILLHNPKCGGTFFRDSFMASRKGNAAFEYWQLYDEAYNIDLGHITLDVLPRFIPNFQQYKILSFVRNPYNRFVSGFKTASLNIPSVRIIGEKCDWKIRHICDYIASLKYYDQDLILRNPRIPWLNPQSNFIGPTVLNLKFEENADWSFILNLFQVTGAVVKIPARPEIVFC